MHARHSPERVGERQLDFVAGQPVGVDQGHEEGAIEGVAVLCGVHLDRVAVHVLSREKCGVCGGEGRGCEVRAKQSGMMVRGGSQESVLACLLHGSALTTASQVQVSVSLPSQLLMGAWNWELSSEGEKGGKRRWRQEKASGMGGSQEGKRNR